MPTISEVKYTKQFNYHGIDEWIGVTIQVQPGEDAKAALHQAKALTEEFYSEISPQHNGSVVIQKEKEPPTVTDTNLEAINQCTTLEELKGYWLISKGNLTLSQAYRAKEKQLQDASN
jgi:hypothetical protein